MTVISTQASKDFQTNKQSLWKIPTVLMLLCGFFLPWGTELESVIHINPSTVFAAIASILVVYWMLFARKSA